MFNKYKMNGYGSYKTGSLISKPKVLIIVNSAEFFLSHRLPIALAARDVGFQVHIATGPGSGRERIQSYGLAHHLLPINRSSVKPWQEFYSFWSFWKLIKLIKPDLLHLVTIKPVLYGGILARFTKVPAVLAAISGLGSVFVSNNGKAFWFRNFIEFLYKQALSHPNIIVVLQNDSDKSLLIKLGAVTVDRTMFIPGSGVALSQYPFKPEPNGVPIVTFASRLLIEKGVFDFLEAARILKNRGLSIRFWLAGAPDHGNSSSVKINDVISWHKSGFIEYLGYRNDISEVLSNSNIVVLPSYYGEGLPKILIEAAACGRPIITTDMPGCRDAIKPNVSGLLVPIRDVNKLADAIESLVLDSDSRKSMGIAGRNFAEKEFTIEKVVSIHLKIYSKLTGFRH